METSLQWVKEKKNQIKPHTSLEYPVLLNWDVKKIFSYKLKYDLLNSNNSNCTEDAVRC